MSELARTPSRPARVVVAIAMGCYGVWWLIADRGATQNDFDQVWYAATALRNGLNPYDVIGPTGTWFHWPWRFYYPMPAVLLAFPLSFLPLTIARSAFVGASSRVARHRSPPASASRERSRRDPVA
jgi:hypothetical protein